MTSNPILPDFLNSEIYDTQVELGSCWDAPCRAAIAFSKCTSSLVLKSLLQEKLFWTSTTKKEAIKLTYMSGSTLANSNPAILEVCIVRFGKALYNCSMDRNLCHDTPSHGCRVGKQSCKRHLKSKKACPIKVICRMASLFVGLMNHHRSSFHPYSDSTDVRLQLAEPKVSRTIGSASNLKGLEAGWKSKAKLNKSRLHILKTSN